MLAMKWLITVLFSVLGLFLNDTAKAGRKIKNLKGDGLKFKEMYVGFHKFFATVSFWLCLISVIAAETYVRMSGGLKLEHKQLFLVHLGFAIPLFLTLAVLRFWLTGLKSPKAHKWLGYTCLIAYCGTFLTGMTLLWR